MKRLATLLLLLASAYAPAQIITSSELRMSAKTAPAPTAGRYKVYINSTSGVLTCIGPGGSNCSPSGGSGDAVTIKGKPVDTPNAAGQQLTYDGTKFARQLKFYTDARDCGVVGDAVTDDGPTIQTCINNNPGKHVILYKTSASVSGGGTPNTISYFSSQTLTLSGNGQILDGGMPAVWNAPTSIKFAPNIVGIRIPTACQGCGLMNLGLTGQQGWLLADLTTYNDWSPTTLVDHTTFPPGLLIEGGEPLLDNVSVEQFIGHCIDFNGNGNQPDFSKIRNVITANCRGYSVFLHNADANAGTLIGITGYNNALGGTYDAAQAGNLHLGSGSHAEAQSNVAAGSTQAVTSINAASGTATLITPAALANGVQTNGNWIAVTSCTDATFNTTAAKILSVNTGTRTITYATTHANGSGGASCLVGSASSTAVQNYLGSKSAGAGEFPVTVGCFIGRDTALGGTWIAPYCESTSFPARPSTSSFIIGGQAWASADDTSYQKGAWLWVSNSVLEQRMQMARVQNHSNSNLQFGLWGGLTQGALTTFTVGKRVSGVNTDLWSFGTCASASDSGCIRNEADVNRPPFRFDTDGTIYLNNRDASGDIRFNASAFTNSTASACNYGGTASAKSCLMGNGQIKSTIATGTQPLDVASTTLVTNLNANFLGGASLDTDGTLAANSNTRVPSQAAVKTYAMPLSGNATFGAFTFDFGGAAHTRPYKVGLIAALPATCTVGEKYFATDATAGQNDYNCTATNTWTQNLNTGGGGGSGVVSPGTANQFTFYTGTGSTVGGHTKFSTDANNNLVHTQGANNTTALQITRATDTSPTGNFENFRNAAATALWTVDITGSLTAGTVPVARLSSSSTTVNGTVCTLGSTCAPSATTLNGATVPVSATVLGSNASSQLIAATTTGSGTTVPLATSPVLTTPRMTVINDANGNPFLTSTATTTAVDSLTLTNAATANPALVKLGATGSDTNINFELDAKGTGVLRLGGANATVDSSGNLTAASYASAPTTDGGMELPNNTILTVSGATKARLIANTNVLKVSENSGAYTEVAKITQLANLYDGSGNQLPTPHTILGACTLGTSCVIALTGNSVFTGSGTYACAAQDTTAAAATRVQQTSGTAFTITGTGTDVIRYSCVGY